MSVEANGKILGYDFRWTFSASKLSAEKAPVTVEMHLVARMLDPTYPNLAGQYASYLERALMDYREGKRTNAIMAGFAQNLTDQDIADLAAWYSSQQGLEDISIK